MFVRMYIKPQLSLLIAVEGHYQTSSAILLHCILMCGINMVFAMELLLVFGVSAAVAATCYAFDCLLDASRSSAGYQYWIAICCHISYVFSIPYCQVVALLKPIETMRDKRNREISNFSTYMHAFYQLLLA